MFFHVGTQNYFLSAKLQLFLIPRHICVTYDGGKDLYKVFIDGVKTESGSWAGDNQVEPVRYTR